MNFDLFDRSFQNLWTIDTSQSSCWWLIEGESWLVSQCWLFTLFSSCLSVLTEAKIIKTTFQKYSWCVSDCWSMQLLWVEEAFHWKGNWDGDECLGRQGNIVHSLKKRLRSLAQENKNSPLIYLENLFQQLFLNLNSPAWFEFNAYV